MEKLDIAAQKVVFTGSSAVLEPFRITGIGPDEILVRTRCSLISIGTETTIYLKNRWNEGAAAPAVPGTAGNDWDFDNYGKGERWDLDANSQCPGYALAGDVVAVGAQVRDYNVGDRVISLHSHSSYAVCSTKPWHTLPIPDGVSYEDATFSVLASVSLHGIHRAGITLGENAVIMGAGLVGQMLIRFAKMCGAYPIISCDLSPLRLELARKSGADYTINPNEENLVDKVRQYAGPEGAGLTIEAVGNPGVLMDCLRISAPGARVVVMGAILGEVPMDLYNQFVFRELSLIASQQPRNPTVDTLYYPNTQQRNRQYILDLIRMGRLSVHDLLTHRFSYTRVPEVYARLAQAKIADYDAQGNVNRDMIGVLLDWED